MKTMWIVKKFDVNTDNSVTCNPTDFDRIDVEIFNNEISAHKFMEKQSKRFSHLNDYKSYWNGDKTLFDVDGKFILKLETKIVND